ncbi:Three prime repair exonuclease 1 [Paragonimus heterotremus]|uniref:Three prime repair exonuclease 1 n=1 Tax=Paragonimus heterotremus TaxID=100268 RepID=A0A8J4SJI4_9TREM|nr:Three prime repair exonuclease 1 [Paragonimus heterotremus]
MLKSAQKTVQKPILLSTLVFLDLETTGLPSASFKPEITELCLLAVSRFALEQTDKPIRVQNKLNLCFHPTRTMQSVAAKISGLNRDNLFHQKDFDTTAVNLLQLFLTRLDPPICLLAHNGNRFDFALLRAQLLGLRGIDFRLLDCHGSPILCADTLSLFTALNDELVRKPPLNDSGFDCADVDVSSDNYTLVDTPLSHSSPKKSVSPPRTVFFQLGNVYSRVFGSPHSNAHSAEGDCIALMDLVQHLGLSAIDWLQTNYSDFNKIPTMYTLPGTRLTTPTKFPYENTEGESRTVTVTDEAVKLSKVRIE